MKIKRFFDGIALSMVGQSLYISGRRLGIIQMKFKDKKEAEIKWYNIDKEEVLNIIKTAGRLKADASAG